MATSSHHIERHDVVSSNIKTMGHDKARRILQVEYHSGAVWNYDNVTESEYLAIKDAPSVGGAFAKHIRDIKVATPVSSAGKRPGAGTRTSLVRRSTERGGLNSANSQISAVHQSRNIQHLIRQESNNPQKLN